MFAALLSLYANIRIRRQDVRFRISYRQIRNTQSCFPNGFRKTRTAHQTGRETRPLRILTQMYAESHAFPIPPIIFLAKGKKF